MSFPVENIARWIIARRIFVLILILTVTVISIIEAGNIKINNNLEIWLERSSDEYSNYLNFTYDFGNDESIILLYHSDSLATNSHLKLNWQFTDRLRSISGVENVISLATIKVPSSSLSGPSVLPLLPKSMSNPERLKDRLSRYRTYKDFLFSDDFKTTSFVIIPDSVANRPAIIEKIELLANRYLQPAGEYVLFGVVPLKESLRTLSVNESGKFLAITIFLLFFMNLILFRRISQALLPLLIALLTIVWIIGLMAATVSEMNIVTSILPIIIMVISIANSIHFITGQNITDRAFSNRNESVIHNFVNKYRKCFFSSLTTSVALFAFVFSDIIPLRQFGLFASIGVLLSFILTFAVLPVIFSYSGSKADVSHGSTPFAGSARFARLINLNRRAIFLTSAFLLFISVIGIMRIDVNTEQITYFKKNHKIRIASEKASEWFAGVLPFELIFKLDTSFFLSPGDHIDRMTEFEKKLGGMASVKSWQSVVTMLNDYSTTSSGMNPLESYAWMDTERGRELTSYFVSEDGMNIRTTIRTPLLNDREEIIMLDELDTMFKDSFNGTEVKFYVTGMATVFAHLSRRLVESQLRSFSFTFIVIFFMFLLLFRSIRMAIVCMLPNILPVACTIGIMGITNIQLDVATILIATVSFGIAVDDTIHFAVTYKEFLIGSDKMRAVISTLVSVGRPIVITSLLLTVGFLSMIFSSYRPIVYMGLFLSVNIILALLGDLILLPAILFYGTKYKDTNL